MGFIILLVGLILVDAHIDAKITSLSNEINILISRVNSIYEYRVIRDNEKQAAVHNLIKENEKLRQQIESPEYQEFLKGYNCRGYHD